MTNHPAERTGVRLLDRSLLIINTINRGVKGAARRSGQVMVVKGGDAKKLQLSQKHRARTQPSDELAAAYFTRRRLSEDQTYEKMPHESSALHHALSPAMQPHRRRLCLPS